MLDGKHLYLVVVHLRARVEELHHKRRSHQTLCIMMDEGRRYVNVRAWKKSVSECVCVWGGVCICRCDNSWLNKLFPLKTENFWLDIHVQYVGYRYVQYVCMYVMLAILLLILGPYKEEYIYNSAKHCYQNTRNL